MVRGLVKLKDARRAEKDSLLSGLAKRLEWMKRAVRGDSGEGGLESKIEERM